jgi:hypothetical protein
MEEERHGKKSGDNKTVRCLVFNSLPDDEKD